MAKTTTVGEGTGITSRTRRLKVLDGTNADDAEEARQFFRGLDQLNAPWGRDARLIEVMRARYEKLQTSAPTDPKLHRELTRPRTSEFSYLFQCARYALLVEKHIEARPWEAVSLAMDLMELLTELSFKEAHERDALDGQKMNEGRLKGGKSRRKQPRQERIDYVNGLVGQGFGTRRAMRDAAVKFGVSYSTIRKDYYSKK